MSQHDHHAHHHPTATGAGGDDTAQELRETVAEMVARGKQVSTVEIADVGHAPTFVDPAQIAIARNFFLGT